LGIVKSIKVPRQFMVILLVLRVQWQCSVKIYLNLKSLFINLQSAIKKNLYFWENLTQRYTEMSNTSQEYDKVIAICRQLYINKMKDYGSAWRILRLPSLTDQIFIKAQRIRSLQQNDIRKVDEDESGEFIGIINYSIMALIQLDLGVVEQPDLDLAKATELYDTKVALTKSLMEAKNHDYGEAWREMRVSSLTDLILQKLLRVKQIEDNQGKTIVSEGIDANYQDMINYSVFALILMKFGQ
jgi:hypothetical protein